MAIEYSLEEIAHLFTGSGKKGGRLSGQSGGVVNGHPVTRFRYGGL